MAVTLVMPHLGEAVTEGTILSWAKQPGEAIAEDEVLLEVSTDTDKVDTEVPSPTAGVIQEILVSAGETVSVGTPLAVIAEPMEAATAPPSAAPAPAAAAASSAPPPEAGPGTKASASPPELAPVSAASPRRGGSPNLEGSDVEGSDTDTEQDTRVPDIEADASTPSGQTWVTLWEAERRTGVAASTLRKWCERDEIASRTAQGATGMQVWVPLEAVSELAARKGAGTVGRGEGPERTGPKQSAEHQAEQEPVRWAIELLALADTRAGQLLDRLAQAERERADAERDAAIERHKREQAEAEAARLRVELAAVTNPEQPKGADPEPSAQNEVPTLYAAFRATVDRWNDRWRRRV